MGAVDYSRMTGRSMGLAMDKTSQYGDARALARGVAAASRAGARGFTLVDVLVSMAVISILIAVLLPSISRVRESAERVICGSNLRQVGMGVHMFAEDSKDVMPPSVFLPGSSRNSAARSSGDEGSPERMDIVRTSRDEFAPREWGDWDGLGLLYADGYLSASKVFYCPSHSGSHSFERYTSAWGEEAGEIVSNYQFRGQGPEGNRRLYEIEPSVAIVSDMLRSYADLNHRRGFNVLKAGLSVNWIEDEQEQIAEILLRTAGDGDGADQSVEDAWSRLDGREPGPVTDSIDDTE